MTTDKIVDAAFILLKKDGLNKLSMRTLAKELNVKAASLYYHISNKTELMGLIADRICGKLKFEYETDSPKKKMTEIFLDYRASLLRVNDAPEIFSKSIPNTPNRIHLIHLIFDCLKDMGIAEENIVTAGNLLNNYVLSFVSDEHFFTSQAESDEESGMHFLTNGLPFHQNFDEQFKYGLAVVLEGLETVR